MGLFSWFSRSKSTDYETVLAQLATEINEAKQNLSEIRLRQRRFTLALNAYGVGLWAVILGLWYWGRLPWGLVGWDAEGTEARVAGGLAVGVAPVVIWLLNRALSWVFIRKRTSEETHLRLLLSKQRNQVEEIKKATNFDTTRKLIEQYEDSPMGTPQRTPQRGPQTPQQSSQPGTPRTPQGQVSPAQPARPQTPVPIPPGLTPEQAAVLQMQMQAITPVLPTPEKKWYDRLADTILGDDPAQAAQSKYALVCDKCFRHNGLIGSKQEWERMQWICPRCNHLNRAPLSRMAAEDDATPPPPPQLSLPETPSKPAKQRAAPTASPLRRAVGERSARSSRLGQAVFSASDADDDSDEGYEAKADAMEVDK
ncbi:hypothetical protein CcaverHIS002_0506750 [Cutaneotrichosporon cavernicola]|uniref:Endoplasmic reticulum junction formation protein lunapark n=1 Tax=Cutaneotrichosporon cavernicola TaxID=279322 RepID=A0AA48L714_9TREE|nr:uncharacterized protein CcaverHIS019_0507280 [Cutaneotrichosporon cavernicola]BEI85274.1 hypothetical protein CcaverHIS002_0506750 [Cutaneotrichosporon cavernicola]BEI93100.1 hypothetical protein CcaverHIS019_0507280 [Cutaneotrichosporon cavernicola]BEJ08643.1 hypothetical protein CcaverHIS641_0507370 [Cutaneotrichosporon cavernicola]